MPRKGEVLEKRFRFAGKLWRLLVEGRIVRVDRWASDGDDSDWSVVYGGEIKAGVIPAWEIIHNHYMPPIPERLGYVAYQHLVGLAANLAGEAEGSAESVERMVRMRSDSEQRGFMRVAARKIGVTVSEYIERRMRGDKWCYLGKHFVPKDDLYPSSKCRTCGGNEHKALTEKRRAAPLVA